MVFENILCYKWNPQPEEGEAGRENSEAKLSSAPVSWDLWLRIGGEGKRMECTRECTMVILRNTDVALMAAVGTGIRQTQAHLGTDC